MQPAYDPASSGPYLSLGIGLIAVFLGLSQWYEWRARDAELPEKERSHYRRQDLRRTAGVVLLLWLAVEIWVGSEIPHRIATRPNPTFLFIWLSVGVKLIVLLALAMLDLAAHQALRPAVSAIDDPRTAQIASGSAPAIGPAKPAAVLPAAARAQMSSVVRRLGGRAETPSI